MGDSRETTDLEDWRLRCQALPFLGGWLRRSQWRSSIPASQLWHLQFQDPPRLPHRLATHMRFGQWPDWLWLIWAAGHGVGGKSSQFWQLWVSLEGESWLLPICCFIEKPSSTVWFSANYRPILRDQRPWPSVYTITAFQVFCRQSLVTDASVCGAYTDMMYINISVLQSVSREVLLSFGSLRGFH